jgi:hypothetical protein
METEDADAQVLRNSEQLHEYLQREMKVPTVGMEKKKGRGILRRFIHYIPAAGVGAVNQRVATAETVKGSSKYHCVEDIGQDGMILCRGMSCHKDEGCWNGGTNLHNDDEQHYPDCSQVEMCGAGDLREVISDNSATHDNSHTMHYI